VHVKKLIWTMKSYDPAFSLLALDHKTTYHPDKDKFPKTGEGFKQLFFPALRNRVTVRCNIHSLMMIKEIKNKKIETTSFLNQPNKNWIYIEADSLRYNITQVVSYLLKLHPNITLCDSMYSLLNPPLYFDNTGRCHHS